MIEEFPMGWVNASGIVKHDWTCGYCGNKVGGSRGYCKTKPDNDRIHICPRCDNPTVFIGTENGFQQIPGASYGAMIIGLPGTVNDLYSEVQRCIQCNAYTSATLALRKLLMHVAVDQGAAEGESFISYVQFLSDKGYIPPNGKEWVDEIRKRGNEATHEIVIMGEEDAKALMDFTEMLLKFVYEFPAKIKRK